MLASAAASDLQLHKAAHLAHGMGARQLRFMCSLGMPFTSTFATGFLQLQPAAPRPVALLYAEHARCRLAAASSSILLHQEVAAASAGCMHSWPLQCCCRVL